LQAHCDAIEEAIYVASFSLLAMKEAPPIAACSDLQRYGNSAIFRKQAACALILLTVGDFLALDHYLAGWIDTEPHLVAVDGDDGDFDVVSDADDFANVSRQNQHESCSRVVIAPFLTKAKGYRANVVFLSKGDF
jgi:hypothetical protein